MTPSGLSRLSEEARKKLKEIAVSAFLMLLRWLVARLMNNPGSGDKKGGVDPRDEK